MPKGEIVGMFIGRVCLSLMTRTTMMMACLHARTTMMMACLHARTTMNQSSRDQKMRKVECVRLTPKVFWVDAYEKA